MCDLLHCMEESFEVKGAAMEASPNFTTCTWSSSSSRRTWLIFSWWIKKKKLCERENFNRNQNAVCYGFIILKRTITGTTFCAASCSSLWAITLCLDALELSLVPEPMTGKDLDSEVETSLPLDCFFLSGMRSGALAKRATPAEKTKPSPLEFSHSL